MSKDWESNLTGPTFEFALRLTEAVVRSNPKWATETPEDRVGEIHLVFEEAIRRAMFVQNNGTKA